MTFYTEDKEVWTKIGLKREHEFCEMMKANGFDVEMNPEKIKNKYAPDLLVEGRSVAEVKCQRTPFFTAGRYGIDPTYAATFNEKDRSRYQGEYPNLPIFFWCKWTSLLDYGVTVEPIDRVYLVGFQRLQREIIDPKKLHEYERRKNDKVNAKDSYVIDVRQLKELLRNN